ncbi:MAG TPA: hypothetical protein DCZ80_04820, partial [Legionellales bacterium]|nr:hypothetical protein [Legionellales bacterium]
MSALYTFIDNLIAATIRKKAVKDDKLNQGEYYNVHPVFDPLIMQNWEKMRSGAIGQGLFNTDDSQRDLYTKLSTLLNLLEISNDNDT